MESTTDSISEWFSQLKAGEGEAAQKLWDRYSSELLRFAKHRLRTVPPGIADEEDLAQSVFGSIWRGAAEGRFAGVTTRDELWWLLLGITKRKTIDHIRRQTAQKRGGRQGSKESQTELAAPLSWSFSIDDLVSSEPTPDFLIALEDQYSRLLGLLRDDRLREIAILRIEGYTVAEIAQRLSIGLRAVERKLQLIRAKWKSELLTPGSTL